MKLLMPVLVVLALAGCAPNTDAAYERCYDYLASSYRADPRFADATTEEQIDYLVMAGERCSSDAKDDPSAFNEQWGD